MMSRENSLRALSALILCFAAVAYPSVASASPDSAGIQHLTYNLLAAGCGGRYVVQRGDSVSAIARRCGVSTWDLIRANNLNYWATIYPGQTLVMPDATTAPSANPISPAPRSNAAPAIICTNPYVVRAGDSLYGIALRCGVGLDNLLQWNGLTTYSIIRPGMWLFLQRTSSTTPQEAAQEPATPISTQRVAPQPTAPLAFRPTPTPSIEPRPTP